MLNRVRQFPLATNLAIYTFVSCFLPSSYLLRTYGYISTSFFYFFFFSFVIVRPLLRFLSSSLWSPHRVGLCFIFFIVSDFFLYWFFRSFLLLLCVIVLLFLYHLNYLSSIFSRFSLSPLSKPLNIRKDNLGFVTSRHASFLPFYPCVFMLFSFMFARFGFSCVSSCLVVI